MVTGIRVVRLIVLPFALVGSIWIQGSGPSDPSTKEWIKAMQKVHSRFTGRKGTFAQLGDSITVTMAFWAPLPQGRKNASPEMEKVFQLVEGYMRPECWREWKGPEYGSEGSQTAQWALEHIEEWLKKLNPEAALIMFGTNDLHSYGLEEYRAKMREVTRKCLDNDTVVILSTIPPRSGYVEKAASFARAIRELASELKVPLIDFYAEIMKRRPEDWDGSLDRFKEWKDYDVPTLLARDGVHPSYPGQYQGDYSEEALRCSCYSLRNYLALMKYADLIKAVLKDSERSDASPKPQQEALLHPPSQPWFPKAPPLPPPQGDIIRVTSVEELFKAAERVKPGGTILVADGHYMMPRYLEIRIDNVTLRSESGKRERVILDGAQSQHGELVGITRCSGVTIADLTIQNIKWNGFKINSDSNVQKVTIYNCAIHNIWQRGVKGVRVPLENLEAMRPRDCRVQYCLFYNDRPKQFSDDPADTAENFNGDYIGGIDVMFAKNWAISDNVFIGIQGRTRQARGAVFLWHDTQNCIVERNIIIDCDTGIALGNSSLPPDITVHCSRVIARNNFLTRTPESGILADYTRDCKILNNTIHYPSSPTGRLIRLVHDNDGLLVANNLLSGPLIKNESSSLITFQNNLVQDITSAFVDPEHGNLRLKTRLEVDVGQAIPLPEVKEDIDRKPRPSRPCIGAHESGISSDPS